MSDTLVKYFVSSFRNNHPTSVLVQICSHVVTWPLYQFKKLTTLGFTANESIYRLNNPWIKQHLNWLEIISNKVRERSGSVLDSRPRGHGFEPHCVVSLSKNINPNLVLVHPRKTRPFITERLLIGCKESNQTNKFSANNTYLLRVIL